MAPARDPAVRTSRRPYFKTANHRFCEQMRPHIVVPYNPENDSVQAKIAYGEIVCIDHLPDGQFGIAVLFGGLARTVLVRNFHGLKYPTTVHTKALCFQHPN
jgi:hypothetical protein